MDITTKVLKYGTMFYINYEECKLRNRILVADYLKGFILTMRNVNPVPLIKSKSNIKRFILTMRNVNTF